MFVGLLDLHPQSRYETMAYVVLVGGGLMTANVAWLAWVERETWRTWLKPTGKTT